ncbi:MAG: rhomboid family intramembrane serine protease [Candidatus Heimdallarchaeota archaeon]|nr:rhomboid family intramembrane serine protease [Candidatus Heimdallarchaeota archaeon]
MKEENKEEDKEFTFSSFWKTNLPTRNIFLIILIVYIISTILSIILNPVQDLIGLVTISDQILATIGQYNLRVFEGHVYQLVTSIFVHTNIIHFLSNSLFLFLYGLRAEEKFLSWQYYLIFVLSGLFGGILSLFAFNPFTISAGASGGIFGLLGADLVLAYQEEKKKSLWVYIGMGGIFLILSAGINVNILAHAIGLISGIIFPLIFKKRKISSSEEISVQLYEEED